MQPLPNSTNLTPEELANSTLYRGPVDPANWFGIRKGFPNWGYVKVGTGILWGPPGGYSWLHSVGLNISSDNLGRCCFYEDHAGVILGFTAWS